jgi:hypothetical protein
LLQLTVETDNEAFHPDPEAEVARLLDVAARGIAAGHWEGRFLDRNGNWCGTWLLTHIPDEQAS